MLIKASAGGGGKGMRLVERSEATFSDALASCKSEARSSFGNEDVLSERYVSQPRHVEVQVFGDLTATTCICLNVIVRTTSPPKST